MPEYHLNILDTILPYNINPSQNQNRHSNGISKPSFYHKDNGTLPAWMETVKIYSEYSKRNFGDLLCQNEDSLLYTATLGC
ncbi:MAG: hypothetical protein Q8O62_06235 [Aequorivita sp.]|nr:hypothetical protein [Aequorivita sp.]